MEGIDDGLRIGHQTGVGGDAERISVPLFFNPSHDTNVAPPESGEVVRAGKHLERRFNETYLHLQKP